MSHPEDCTCFPCKARSIGFVGTKLRGDRSTFQRDREKRNDFELSESR